jgi:hypothetical protein
MREFLRNQADIAQLLEASGHRLGLSAACLGNGTKHQPLVHTEFFLYEVGQQPALTQVD